MKQVTLKERVSKHLYVGQEFKSYRAVCEALGDKIKNGGTSKEAQLKEWGRYFNHTKDGNKWIITEIYDQPLNKYDARSLLSGGGAYTDDLQTLILLLADVSGAKDHLVITHNNLITQLGLVNQNYQTGKHHSFGMEKMLNVSSEVLSDFFTSTDRNIKRMIETALNKLDTKALARWKKVRVLKRCDKEQGDVATREEDACILEMERQVMDELGCKDESEVFYKGLSQTYYNQVVMNLNNKFNLNIDYYFRAYEIIYSSKFVKRELEKLSPEEYSLASQRLNKNLQTNLVTNARNRQRRVNKKVAEYKRWQQEKQNIGVKSLVLSRVEVARQDESYVDSTKKLIETTIDSKSENKGEVIVKGHYEVLNHKAQERAKKITKK